MVLHLIQHHGRADSNKVKAIVVIEGMAVHEDLRSAGCIACWPAEPGATNLNFLTVNSEESRDNNRALQASMFI